MRTNFEHELRGLHTDIIKMGSLIETAIKHAVEAFKDGNTELCEEIILGDQVVDEVEKSIESRCLWLIVKEQPIAMDIRKITSALKMITDMERIGDNAADIAELVMRVNGENIFANSGHIPQMASIAAGMVRDSISSYVSADLDLADEIISRDDEVDELFNIVKNELTYVFKTDEKNMDHAIDFLMIAKYLERIADHAVNICEWVQFCETGKHKETRIF